ncbi:MAG: YiiX family permuted papain-like enzyme [Bacteroidia bacterium]|nr:YiiX family permuted papain-like enzyme [Bacteroidia bacterium]
MKKFIAIFAAFAIVTAFLSSFNFPLKLTKSQFKFKNTTSNQYHTGDLIFQTNTAGQGMAIQIATKSKITHVGMICVKNGENYVYEANGPVSLTPLKQFISHGSGNHFTVKRLKNESVLNDSVRSKMITIAETYIDKPYDIWFGWNDDYIYCSELVWKIYKNTSGIDIGKLQKLKEFDLTNPIVKSVVTERYGTNIPYDETVISPAAIFNYPDLIILETK